MRFVLVGNPRSGGATDPDALARALGDDVVVVPIGEQDRIAGLRPDRVVVAGGDGSIGPVAAVCAPLGLPLAVLPAGTANDLARAAAIPLDLDEAVALACDPDAPLRPLTLHRAGPHARPFVNAAAAGLSVDAAEAAHDLKGALGPLAYAVGALRAGATGDPVPFTVEVDGRPVFDGDAWQVVVGGTGHFGGGSALDADAALADDALDVAVLTADGRLGLAQHARAMRNGELVDADGVLHVRGTRVTVRGAERFNVDGELCDDLDGTFEHRGEHVTLVVGPGEA